MSFALKTPKRFSFHELQTKKKIYEQVFLNMYFSNKYFRTSILEQVFRTSIFEQVFSKLYM
jgi:hypothetical protein